MNERRSAGRSPTSRARRDARGRRVPRDAGAWLSEIAAAYRDAREAIPFGDALGEPFGENELFHLAPIVALKFRGLPVSGRRLREATDAALASYVANRGRHRRALEDPLLADEPMEYAIRHRKELARLIGSASGDARGVRRPRRR
jgi:hypothetical protein